MPGRSKRTSIDSLPAGSRLTLTRVSLTCTMTTIARPTRHRTDSFHGLSGFIVREFAALETDPHNERRVMSGTFQNELRIPGMRMRPMLKHAR